ncbi:hypothetical protein PISMIDRAFT_25100 [Pisolithus microcarpus 441]|uniref:Uncharacterized protein n=1 Tax=Pisolithus microcarpus 441 TaxID=765257 RepID=A0A0C9Z9I3_9AGAM|nr:hypothetical protein BKA83DRAFT_25100 [Pisolithus microcarpus]KIK16548.1 hypothetical protein PISMIDRAFT_25100 [Pisolithus microcarpus 441]
MALSFNQQAFVYCTACVYSSNPRLPDGGQANSRNQPRSSCGGSGPLTGKSGPSSFASSVFLSNNTGPSTIPTSRPSSISSSCKGDGGSSQQSHVHSFSLHLKMLALASQSGIEAPACISHMSSGMVDPCQDSHQLRSPQNDELEEAEEVDELEVTTPPPPRSAKLQCMVTFYTPLDGHRLGHNHTLSAVPNPGHDGFRDHGTNVNEDESIDRTLQSDGERLADAIAQSPHPPTAVCSQPLTRTQGHTRGVAKDVVAAHCRQNPAPCLLSNSQLQPI